MSIEVEDKTKQSKPNPADWSAKEAENRFWEWVNFLTKYAVGSKLEANSGGFGQEEKVAFVSALGALSRIIMENSSENDRRIYEQSIQVAMETLQPYWESLTKSVVGMQ